MKQIITVVSAACIYSLIQPIEEKKQRWGKYVPFYLIMRWKHKPTNVGIALERQASRIKPHRNSNH